VSADTRPEQRLWFRDAPALAVGESPLDGVVFDPATGETHFLNELPALLLSSIDGTPRPIAALVERIAGPTELDAEARTQIIGALVSLERAELVESRLP